MKYHRIRLGTLKVLLLALAATLSACVTNPVTGKRELRLMSEAQEIQQGVQAYSPLLQGQGGSLVVDPALQSYVSNVGQRLAAVSDRPLPYEFTVLNNSVPNAWALPGGKIAINRGLLTELQSEGELAAVLGHEIVHAAAGHSAQQMSRGMLLQGGILATAIAANDSDYANVLMMGANVGAQLINQRYGRKAELDSDLYGMEYMSQAGYDPVGAVELQQTFVRLSEGRPTDWLSGLFASHPPSTQRVNANLATAGRLPGGGERGQQQYKRAMQNMINAKPAYDAYDEGRKALSEGNVDTARSKARAAIKAFPKEAHFHALMGDIERSRKNADAAIKHYNQAIARNDQFFYYHLQRGMISEQRRDDDVAARDLKRSLELMPNAPAYYGLGNIARRQNRTAEAVEYYQVARQAGGNLGIEAETSLLELDLANNPDKYVQTRSGVDNDGKLMLEIGNSTQVRLEGIALQIQYLDSSGKAKTINRQLNGDLEGGKALRLNTGLGPFTSSNQYQVRIVGARIAD